MLPSAPSSHIAVATAISVPAPGPGPGPKLPQQLLCGWVGARSSTCSMSLPREGSPAGVGASKGKQVVGWEQGEARGNTEAGGRGEVMGVGTGAQRCRYCREKQALGGACTGGPESRRHRHHRVRCGVCRHRGAGSQRGRCCWGQVTRGKSQATWFSCCLPYQYLPPCCCLPHCSSGGRMNFRQPSKN